MPNVLRRILRFAHRSDGQGLNHICCRGISHFRQHFVQASRNGRFIRHPYFVSKLLYKNTQVLQFLRIWIVVYPVNKCLS